MGKVTEKQRRYKDYSSYIRDKFGGRVQKFLLMLDLHAQILMVVKERVSCNLLQ